MGKGQKSSRTVKDQSGIKESTRAIIRRDGGFYVVVEILKKVKFKDRGVVNFDKPVISVLVHVIESNLPMPANTYNPIFMFKRECNVVKKVVDAFEVTDGNDTYIGMPTPEEYFTLPDFGNHINADVPIEVETQNKTPAGYVVTENKIGLHYVTANFVQRFESVEVADAFLTQMEKDIAGFLVSLEKFWKGNVKLLSWSKLWTIGVTKGGAESECSNVMIPSFTEGKGKIQ